jgi:uncharacterized protein
MFDISPLTAFVAAAFVAAGFSKGVLGMGLPTIAMGLLGIVMPPATAASLLVIPSLVTNIWQLFAGPRFVPLARRLATMMIGVCIGTALTIGVLTGQSASFAGAALGAVLLLYGVIGLVARRFTVSPAAERWASPLVGFITGLITGATGIFVIPAVPYLNSLGLSKDELIQALGLSFTTSTLALGAALFFSGAYQASAVAASLLAVPPALLGMVVGQRVRHRLKPEVFRRWFFIGLIVLGAYMVLRVLVKL